MSPGGKDPCGCSPCGLHSAADDGHKSQSLLQINGIRVNCPMDSGDYGLFPVLKFFLVNQD